jgi:hypothetical protein
MFSADGERQILPRQTKSNLQGIGIIVRFRCSWNNDQLLDNENLARLCREKLSLACPTWWTFLAAPVLSLATKLPDAAVTLIDNG